MPVQVTDWGEALLTSMTAAFVLFFSAIPKILAFALIVIVGWIVAGLLARALAAVLRKMRFNELAQRAGLAEFVMRMGLNTDAAGMIALVLKWLIRLVALVVAFDALGLPAVSDVMRELLVWLPNVVVAIVVLVVGGLAARALGNLVRGIASEAGLSNSNVLARVASGLVWAFAIVVAVNQIGIATTLVNTLFIAIVSAVALAAGLAFGLGGRETAAIIVRNWYERAQTQSRQIARTHEAADAQRAAVEAAQQAGSWPAGGYPGTGMGPAPADKRHPSEGG